MSKGVRRRTDGKFIADIQIGGVRRTAVRKTERDARQARSELKAILEGKIPDRAAPRRSDLWTLKHGSEMTFDRVWKRTRSERTHLKNVRQIIRFFGEETQLESIRYPELDNFVQHCKRYLGNSGSTINRKLSCLSQIMRTAIKFGGLSSRPVFPREPENSGRTRFLSEREEADLLRILTQLEKPEQKNLIVFLIDTGFRTGEALKLEFKDIDLKLNQITLWETKTNCPRTVPMTSRVRQIVESRATQGLSRVFPYSADWLRAAWDKTRHIMGLDTDSQFVPHMLRHTCASRLVQRGVPLLVVKEWMGHKNILTTQRYAHLAPAQLHKAVEVLER